MKRTSLYLSLLLLFIFLNNCNKQSNIKEYSIEFYSNNKTLRTQKIKECKTTKIIHKVSKKNCINANLSLRTSKKNKYFDYSTLKK